MFHKLLLALLFFLFPSTLPAAPQLQAEVRTYSVHGTVVNSATGEPVNGALVAIYGPRQRSLLTAADGKFQFDGFPSGMFQINARKPGYFPVEQVQHNGGPPMFVRPEEDRPVTLKLVPEGVIYGRITGDNGESVGFMPVQILGDRFENGRRTRQNLRSVRTDEEGEFRLAELQPGNYFVFIGPSSWPVSFPARLSQTGARGYPGLFYPGVPDLRSATPVAIAPGTHAEINLSLTSQPFYRITGTVSGYSPEQGASFEISNAAGQPVGAGIELDEARGTFRSSWVPAGICTIFGQSQDGKTNQLKYVVQRLNVTSDLGGVHLALLPSATIPVNVRVEATRSESPPTGGSYFFSSRGGKQVRAPQPTFANVVLRLQEQISSQTQQQYSPSVTEEDLTPAIRNVPPGVYSVEANPDGAYYVQSVRSGSVDLLEQGLTVTPGGSNQPIEVVLRDDFATVQGSVTLGSASDATVVIIPANPRDNTPQHRRISTVSRATPSFYISQLPPGEYKLFAIGGTDDVEYGNPDVMAAYLSKAQDLSLLPNQQAKVELQVAHIGETQ